MNWLEALPKNRQRGSFPRCLLLMSGERAMVAERLTRMVGLTDVRVEAEHCWMPMGLPTLSPNGLWDLTPIEEAKLGEHVGLLPEGQRKELTDWWITSSEKANTPNWDIASTCIVGGKVGLLLVEAKAHYAELKKDGKPLASDATSGSKRNHEKIGRAVCEASSELEKAICGWNLRCDSHYQLANRFAWAWKMASMNVPVLLVYLGFLNAEEMSDQGEPFVDCADWSRVVLDHSRNIVPEKAWGRELNIGNAMIKPLIRVWEQELPAST